MTNGYHYRESGLPNVYLEGIEPIDTPYGPAVSIPAVEELHELIGTAIAKANRQMTGPEVRFLRTELDLSQRVLAGLLDVQENTLRRWELGETKIPGPAQRALAGYYLESINGGNLRDLMQKLAETDRRVTELTLKFAHMPGGWEDAAA
ncbi:hypothetical protein BMG00_11230 [Thioclava marina]|uniref:HTH cro/C1-type domain-containing protein n=1 Tax=Thioclava marina TaxID=1915077 RepID=A0ABX3MJD6_9RHOB|nr:helix-turn-helix domain-containing protein [Thioclava marina]OOY11667.1 hypothetical protein BMG00_11230 [Thioclava marina]